MQTSMENPTRASLAGNDMQPNLKASEASQNGDKSVVPYWKRRNEMYSKPLPIKCHPLPAFIPHNPISWLQLAYALFSEFFSTPESHPKIQYKGIFSEETQSVHITDQRAIRALWEAGFFGKGHLSRSEPNWLEREKRKLGIDVDQTAEEFRENRRAERRQMKYERALQQREAIENQQIQEFGRSTIEHDALHRKDLLNETEALHRIINAREDSPLSHQVHSEYEEPPNFQYVMNSGSPENVSAKNAEEMHRLDRSTKSNSASHCSNGQPAPPQTEPPTAATGPSSKIREEIQHDPEVSISNIEHLQLAPEEAFFLSYGLGILAVCEPGSSIGIPNRKLLRLFREKTYGKPDAVHPLQPDDPFLLKYVVYHYFRSLGWVVRHGIKFSADFMLYSRGPVFNHAEFAISIIPSYSDPYWATHPQLKQASPDRENMAWWNHHCFDRIQSHVRKTHVLVYIEIPPPIEDAREVSNSIGDLLRQYKVHEVVNKRFAIKCPK
jgi:tRNA-splicing endonuclease subunit Sen2